MNIYKYTKKTEYIYTQRERERERETERDRERQREFLIVRKLDF